MFVYYLFLFCFQIEKERNDSKKKKNRAIPKVLFWPRRSQPSPGSFTFFPLFYNGGLTFLSFLFLFLLIFNNNNNNNKKKREEKEECETVGGGLRGFWTKIINILKKKYFFKIFFEYPILKKMVKTLPTLPRQFRQRKEETKQHCFNSLKFGWRRRPSQHRECGRSHAEGATLSDSNQLFFPLYIFHTLFLSFSLFMKKRKR